jgi:hypothetical protein
VQDSQEYVQTIRRAKWRTKGPQRDAKGTTCVGTNLCSEVNVKLTRTTAPDKQERLLNDPNPGHFSLIRAYHLADFITLMNGFCGVMSILSSMRYCLAAPHETGNLWAALGFMPFGLFFDFFDGKVARWRKKSSLMGAELDSLADLVRQKRGVGI